MCIRCLGEYLSPFCRQFLHLNRAFCYLIIRLIVSLVFKKLPVRAEVLSSNNLFCLTDRFSSNYLDRITGLLNTTVANSAGNQDPQRKSVSWSSSNPKILLDITKVFIALIFLSHQIYSFFQYGLIPIQSIGSSSSLGITHRIHSRYHTASWNTLFRVVIIYLTWLPIISRIPSVFPIQKVYLIHVF